MNYKITNAEVKGEEVVVHASFLSGKKVVKKIIHAFPRTMSEKEIRGEVEKAMKLHFSEQERAKEQKKVDKAMEEDKKLINNLID
jgi:hypothetical protein